jgi:hypothetical protein
MGAAMRAIPILILVVLALTACDFSDRMLNDISFGEEIDLEYETALQRSEFVLSKWFPKGLDPDRSKPEEGVFWTVWHYYPSTWNRETKRRRAHLEVMEAGEGKVRVGVAVVYQINDNIDNPHVIDEARWVKATREYDFAERIEKQIARPYLDTKPSAYWQEKHLPQRRKTLRPDLVDRTQDVDLEEVDPIDDPDKEMPRTAGR